MKISALPVVPGNTVDGTETVPVVKGGETGRSTIADLTAPAVAEAAMHADRAEAAALAAAIAAPVYASVAEGLAATGDGEEFRALDDYGVGFYRNVAGEAVLLLQMFRGAPQLPTRAALAASTTALATGTVVDVQGYAERGDGGEARFVAVAAPPDLPGTLETASGQHFTFYTKRQSLTPQMFGGIPGEATPSQMQKAVQECLIHAAATDCEALLPASSVPYDVDFGFVLPDGLNWRWDGHFRQVNTDPIVGGRYWQRALCIVGHGSVPYSSHLWKSALADPLVGGPGAPFYGSVLHGEFTLAPDGIANPAYGATYSTYVGPTYRAGGVIGGAPLPLYPDALPTYANLTLALLRIAPGDWVIVGPRAGYNGIIGPRYTDAIDGLDYRGTGGISHHYYGRRHAKVIDIVDGNRVILDRDDAGEIEDAVIFPAVMPWIVDPRAYVPNYGIVPPRQARNINIYGTGTAECLDVSGMSTDPALEGLVDRISGATFQIRTWVDNCHVELERTISEFGLGGNGWTNSSQKFAEVVALRKCSDVPMGCFNFTMEAGAMRNVYRGNRVTPSLTYPDGLRVSSGTGLVMGENSSGAHIRLGELHRGPDGPPAARLHLVNDCSITIDRADMRGLTGHMVINGTATLTYEDFTDEETGFYSYVGTPPTSDRNSARLNQCICGDNIGRFLYMYGGDDFTLTGNFLGNPTIDAARLAGARPKILARFESGSIDASACTGAIIDSNRAIVGHTATTVQSAYIDGVRVFPGTAVHADLSGGAAEKTEAVDAAAGQIGENLFQHAISARDTTELTLALGGVARDGSEVLLQLRNDSAPPMALAWPDDVVDPGAADITTNSTSFIRLLRSQSIWIPQFVKDNVPLGDSLWERVVFLSGFNGADASTAFTDESSYAHAVSAGGNAQLDTAQFRFGASSLLCDGNTDLATIVDAPELAFGNGDFTVEAWIRATSLTNGRTIAAQWGASPAFGWQFLWDGNMSTLRFNYSTNGTAQTNAQGAWAPVAATWYHVAACRAGSALRLFAGGVMVGKKEIGPISIFNNAVPLSIGATSSGSASWNGHLDEVRITKAALYPGDAGFAVPTAGFPRGSV